VYPRSTLDVKESRLPLHHLWRSFRREDSMIIRDPLTQEGARVNPQGQLVTRSIIEAEIERASESGLAFSWYTGDQNIDINDTLLFVKNTSSDSLHLTKLRLNGDSTNPMIYDIGLGSETTTPAGGTEITAVNLNHIFTSVPPDAVARTDETAVADATPFMRIKVLADVDEDVLLIGIILGKNHYIQINCETEPAAVSATLVGHY